MKLLLLTLAGAWLGVMLPLAAAQAASPIGPPGFICVELGDEGSHFINSSGGTPEAMELCGVWVGNQSFLRLRACDGGTLILDTLGSQIDTVLGVYIGTNLLDIHLLVCDDNGAPDSVSSLVGLEAIVGTDYIVAVAGVSGAMGIVQLNYALGVAPFIDQATTDMVMRAGDNLTLSIASTHWVPPPGHQWWRDEAAIPNATNQILTLTNIQTNQAGTYSVVVSNRFGITTNRVASVQVMPAVRLQIASVTSADGVMVRLTTLERCPLILTATTNWIQWLPLYTNSVLDTALDFLDGPMTNHSMRFYRAELWPEGK